MSMPIDPYDMAYHFDWYLEKWTDRSDHDWYGIYTALDGSEHQIYCRDELYDKSYLWVSSNSSERYVREFVEFIKSIVSE